MNKMKSLKMMSIEKLISERRVKLIKEYWTPTEFYYITYHCTDFSLFTDCCIGYQKIKMLEFQNKNH